MSSGAVFVLTGKKHHLHAFKLAVEKTAANILDRFPFKGPKRPPTSTNATHVQSQCISFASCEEKGTHLPCNAAAVIDLRMVYDARKCSGGGLLGFSMSH